MSGEEKLAWTPMQTIAAGLIDLSPRQQPFDIALRQGLTRSSKAIPAHHLYDAAGSRLFDQICQLPEYYVTRTEMGILRTYAQEMSVIVGPLANLIEFGAGSAAKAVTLLDELLAPLSYLPIDVSIAALDASTAAVAARHPGLCITAIRGNYLEGPLPRLPTSGRHLGFFPGSTIGNLEPRRATDFLKLWREPLGPRGLMLVGVDLRKDPAIIRAAYDDAAGVTKAFIRNVLARANREARANFDLTRFRYRPEYDEETGRVRMELESEVRQTVRLGRLTVTFDAGERIHVEDSWKYSMADFRLVAEAAGFQLVQTWCDPDNFFSLRLLRVA